MELGLAISHVLQTVQKVIENYNNIIIIYIWPKTTFQNLNLMQQNA